MKRITLLCCLGSVFGLLAPAQSAEKLNERPVKQAAESPSARRKETRQREGAKFTEQTGRFQLAGDRVVFIPEKAGEENSFRVLENLTLERVLENLNESQSDRLWTVSGVVTEFRSGNYLLLSKAVVETKDTANETPY